jgi:hypothetical protein
MRIPKFLLAVCAVTVYANFTSVNAQDNSAQAAARAAVEQKMRELDAQSSQTNTAPSAPQNETPPSQPAPSVSTEQTPATSAAAVSTPSAETNGESQAAAQAALEAKMRELNIEAEGQKQGAPILVNSSGAVTMETPTNETAPAMIPPTTSAPVEEQAVKTPPTGSSGLFEPAAPTASNNEAQSAAAASLQQKMAELNQGQTTQFQPVPAAPPESSSPTYSGKASAFEPMVAPPLPISPDKQAQLQALNAKYMANEISPEDYFKQREEILGKP